MNRLSTITRQGGLSILLIAISCNLSMAKPASRIPDSGGNRAMIRPMARVPVGLYYMQVYLVVSRYLKKTAWYFAPDGTVYANITGGITPADLARHKSWKGRARMAGNDMEIRWSDGSINKSELIPKNGGFDWSTSDSGMFLAVKPYTDWKQLVGSYEGGRSSSSGGGFIYTANTITLRPDGSYTREGRASVGSSYDGTGTQARTGAQNQNTGTWRFDGQYSIQFTDRTGKASRYLVFPAIDGMYVEDTFCKRIQ